MYVVKIINLSNLSANQAGYVCLYIDILYLYVYIYIYLFIYMQQVSIHKYICITNRVHVSLSPYIYVCVHICVYIYINMYILRIGCLYMYVFNL